MDERVVIGLVEKVTINGKTYRSRIDTGAQMSSLDERLAHRLGFTHVIKTTTVRSANGTSLRKVVRIPFTLKGKKMNASFSIADRSQMNYRVLIGRNVLKRGFLIDPRLEN